MNDVATLTDKYIFYKNVLYMNRLGPGHIEFNSG